MVVVAFPVVTIAVVDAPVKSWPEIAVPLTVLWPMITVVEVDGTVTLMMYVAVLEASFTHAGPEIETTGPAMIVWLAPELSSFSPFLSSTNSLTLYAPRVGSVVPAVGDHLAV